MRRRVSLLRIGAVSALAGTAMVLLGPLLPLGDGVLAMTFCYPLIGPVTRINPELDGDLLIRVEAHESTHARQCRDRGALRHYLRHVTMRGRMQLEAEAFCEETRAVLHAGMDTAADVRAGMRANSWARRFTSEQMDSAAASVCPEFFQ